MLKTIRKHGITLALFAAGSTGLTAAINQMTKTTIAEQASLQQKALFDQVLPAERYNNALAQSCYLVTAPELGKGEHRVYIAKQDEKPVAAGLEAWFTRQKGRQTGSPPFWKQPRQMAIPVRFSCWWEPILTARYLARA